MKKTILAITLAILLSNQVFAEQSEAEINEKLATIGFGKLFAFDPQTQIKNLFADYVKYGNKHDLKKIQSFYDEKYVNADGFDFKTYFSLITQTWETYPDITYSIDVKNIIVNGDYATVQTKETAHGNAKKPSEYLEDKALLENSSDVVYYLKKSGNRWLICSESTISEKTFLKYGDAKDIAFDIAAPSMAVAGQEYSVLFAADVPKDKIMLGSITNEKITYPSERAKEVFRKLKADGMLERVVRANDKGYNEQAVVSVGVTKTEISEAKDLKVSVSGVAFLMSRVNVVEARKLDLNTIIKTINDEEESEDTKNDNSKEKSSPEL